MTNLSYFDQLIKLKILQFIHYNHDTKKGPRLICSTS
jgi:hypothetical protein